MGRRRRRKAPKLQRFGSSTAELPVEVMKSGIDTLMRQSLGDDNYDTPKGTLSIYISLCFLLFFTISDILMNIEHFPPRSALKKTRKKF